MVDEQGADSALRSITSIRDPPHLRDLRVGFSFGRETGWISNDRSVADSKPNETFNAEGRGEKKEDRGGNVRLTVLAV